MVAVLAVLAASCGGSSGGLSGSPCQLICEKRNSCAMTADERVPCDAICVYGANYGPGLAPSPVCPKLAAQTSCVRAAVQLSCDAYSDAAFACPPCGVLDGAPCASNGDCQKYQPNYLCDLSRPGAKSQAATRGRFVGTILVRQPRKRPPFVLDFVPEAPCVADRAARHRSSIFRDQD